MAKTNDHSVPVLDRSHTLYSVTDKGAKIPIGEAKVRMYQGESTFRNSLLPALETEEKLLKPTAQQWTPMDHYDVLELLLNEGWQFSQHSVARGGLSGHFLLTHPEGAQYKDLFNWDVDIWGRDAGKHGGLTEAILVKHHISPGSSTLFMRGFFRYVCTNGLMDEVMNLAHFRMNSTNWSDDRIYQELLGTPTVSTEKMMGPKVGTPQGASRFMSFLQDFYFRPESQENLPEFARNIVRPFQGVNEWVGLNAVQVFGKLAEAKQDVRRLDLVNAWTSAINMPSEEGVDRAITRSLNKVPALVQSTSDLMGIYSM